VKSSLVYLLFIASAFSFFLQDLSDGTIIAVILLINTLLGFFQEYRAEKTVEKLEHCIRKQTLVKRDGQTILMDESLLVPGDVIHLREGDIVPADCKLLTAEKSLRSFSALLIKVVLITLAVVLVFKVILTAHFSQFPLFLLFAVALAIAVVPEALPVIATVTLSTGAVKPAKLDVIVKRLSSIEDLGNITLLCTDKTGTLTENTMTIQKMVSDDATRFQQFAYATLEGTNEDEQRNSYDAAF
jgi:magnesium-transporting ATPase (P-type)